jgi:hypothetical protein
MVVAHFDRPSGRDARVELSLQVGPRSRSLRPHCPAAHTRLAAPAWCARTPKGVTVLPSAEGPSLRSDRRWNARRAQRSEQLLRRLVAHDPPGSAGGSRR